MANAAERWIIIGDSIMASAWTADGQALAPASDLTASQIPSLANVTIQNLSSPGFRVSQGALPGFGACANRFGLIGGAIGLVPPTGIIIALGVNDWGSPAITGLEFTNDYTDLVQFCVSMGMETVCAAPAWHQAESNPIIHSDAGYFLQNFRDWISTISAGNGADFIDATESPLTNHPEYYCDPVHWNGDGHKAFAPWLVSRMQISGHWL